MRIFLTLAVATMALSGCSGANSDDATNQAAKQLAASNKTDAAYVRTIRAASESFANASDEQLVDSAKSICNLFKRGFDPGSIEAATIKYNNDPAAGKTQFKESVKSYCPEFTNAPATTKLVK